MKAFTPTGDTVSITVGATTDSVNLGSPDQVRVMNNGSATVWIAFGASDVEAAAATGMPVGPGVTDVLSISSRLFAADVYVAAIAAAATGVVYFTPGTGI